MLRKISLFISAVLVLNILLTGCYDSMEIDSEVYALVLGIDKGVNNKIILSIQYSTYKSSGGGSSEESGKNGEDSQSSSNKISDTNIQTIEAPSILEGIDMLGMAVSRRISLMHTKMIVFSEEIAKEGVGNYIAPIVRYRETRKTMHVAIVKGKAEEFINENKTNIGDSLAKAIELLTTQSKNTGFFPEARFTSFYRGIMSSYESAVAIHGGINNFDKLPKGNHSSTSPLIVDTGFLPDELPRKGVTKREFVGTAVFRGDKLAGALNSNETRYYLLLLGKYKRGIITIDDREKPGNEIAVDIRLGRHPMIKCRFENGNPVIDVNLKIESEIESINSRINYESIDNLDSLDSQIKDYLQSGLNKLIEKTQKELKADIFGFGHKVAGYFPTIQEWEQYNWPSHYPYAKVNLTVDVSIRRTGLLIYSSPFKAWEDKTEEKEGKK
ncbi:spore germination protein KC [Ruminiclostridium sufflavum DSM 19573]|uniref:Spore germination protein KC n=1 Tax=Ruminiclostridium sufflavum DSM 19573 TaxID=1121337 RepID=A0A318XP47_9FIRM|nr:Ger(x)C family spore germination protein [Ruminiclostridium sufflavum]PYG87398.1 spore germination protein KC [Ruminiclostridium sufflavum DSM 19573]